MVPGCGPLPRGAVARAAFLEGEPEDLPEHQGPGVGDAAAGTGLLHREYTLLVDTGTAPSSSTRAEVFVQLLGSRGRTGLIRLKRGFQQGTRTEFSLFAGDVGRVEKMRLALDAPDRWFCDRVWLQSPEGAREFPVGQYIGWPNNPEVTVTPALAALGTRGVATAALLSRFTGCTAGGRRECAAQGARRRCKLERMLQRPRCTQQRAIQWLHFL
mmetsp:Transcript_55230/g.177004  ORF Transcript_55230/g.177004 Transcript_55230/m.177004 type:complete len:214 (+) Transcript_55230:96-737(+)